MRLMEHKITETELQKMFMNFNKRFFDDKLLDVPINIVNTIDGNSQIAGGFFFSNEMIKQLKITEPKFQQDYIDYMYSEYGVPRIDLVQDVTDKGYYITASILIHEMIHEWVAFILKDESASLKFGGHGKAFRDKVDEINKKSNDEFAVGYTEITSAYVDVEDTDEGYGQVESKTYYLSLNTNSKSITTTKMEYPPIFFDKEHFNFQYLRDVVRGFAENMSFMTPQRFNYEIEALYRGFTIFEFQTNAYVNDNYFNGEWYFNPNADTIKRWKIRDYKLDNNLKNLLKNIKGNCVYKAIGYTNGEEDEIGYRFDKV